MTDTRYLPFDKACGPHRIIGAAIAWAPAAARHTRTPPVPPETGAPRLLPRIAPTAHDDESKVRPRRQPPLRHAHARHRSRPHHAPHGRSRRPRRRLLHRARRLALRAGAARPPRWPPTELPAQAIHAPTDDHARAARPLRRTTVLANSRRTIRHRARRKGRRARCSRRATPRSTDRTCAATAGTSTPPSPSPAA